MAIARQAQVRAHGNPPFPVQGHSQEGVERGGLHSRGPQHGGGLDELPATVTPAEVMSSAR